MTRRRRRFAGIVLGIVVLGTLMSGISLIPDPSGIWPYVIAGAAFLVALLTQPLGTLFEGWMERRLQEVRTERRAERVPGRDRVRDWTDGRELGVHRAKQSDERQEPLPPYVPRSFDSALDRAILAGGLVVLEGESVSGKTRSAYEAILRTVPDRRLVVPSDEQSLTAIADLSATPRNTVVWLDEVDRYLAAGTLNEGVLDRLCPPDRTDVCLVATLDSRMRGDLPKQFEPTVTRILEDRAEHFFVARRLTEAELEGARRHAGDGRISQALTERAGGGFAADIAGAHTALRRWRSAVHGHNARAGAVVSAAVDARRLGYRDPLPRELLEELHRHYLGPDAYHDPGTPTFDEALRWATDPAGGAAGCLSRVGEGTYEPFHHLVSHVLREPDAAEVPEVVWGLIPHRIPLAYLSAFGFAAYESGRFTIAEHAWARFLARFPEHPEANLGKALLTLRSGDRSGALPFLRQAVAEEDPRAMARLGAVLARIALDGEDPSAADEADDWLRRAHDAGERTEACLPGLLAYRTRDESGALFWFDVAAGQGDGNAMFLHACLQTWGVGDRRLLRLLDEVLGEDRPEKLHELLAVLPHTRAERSGDRPSFHKSRWGSKAAAGNVHAMYLMGRSLEAGRRWKGALVMHQGAAQKGSLASARRVSPVYRALNQHQRASAWREAVFRTAATGAAVSGVGALAEQILQEYEESGSKGGTGTITVADAVEPNVQEWSTGRAGWGDGTSSSPGHRSSSGSSASDGPSPYDSAYSSDSSPSHDSSSSGSPAHDPSSSGSSSSYGGDDY